ncbi:Polyphenol oxidase latent form, chloroplastic [Linum perenne]
MRCSSSLDEPASSRRRDMLLGLGGAGLYGATTTLIDPFTGSAFGAPIEGPSMHICKTAQADTDSPFPVQCCPPPFSGKDVKHFTFPDPSEPRRLRRPAHLASKDKEYVAKFEKGIKAMKCLSPDDPLSFVQQARIHCAYCNGSYVQAKHPSEQLQIHGNWFFLPFHRMYLYFFERIIGKLIKDNSFALPYWNWDYAQGMNMPHMMVQPESPLFDGRRNDAHYPPFKPLDINWSHEEDKPIQKIVHENYHTIKDRTVTGAKSTLSYYGDKFSAGSPPPSGAGSGEMLHNMPHNWTGSPFGEDMGVFYSAARDPIFFLHHSNIDRLWNIWKTIDPKTRVDFPDDDFREASFLFYDENRELVRIKVKDVLDNFPLGYDYEDSPTPWREINSTPNQYNTARKKLVGAAASRKMIDAAKLTPQSAFPVKLDKAVNVTLTRPKKGRSKKEKQESSEILVIHGIEFGGDKVISFDVLVNDEPENPSGPSNSEFAGTFVHVPHGPTRHVHAEGKKKHTANFRMDITDLVDDIGAENDDDLLVTFIPKISDGSVSIGGVSIELESLLNP